MIRREEEDDPRSAGAPPGDGDPLKQDWERLQGALRRHVNREQFETWFRRAVLRRVEPGEVCLAVQNGFIRDWLYQYYMRALEQAVEAVYGDGREIVIEVDPELTVETPPRAPVPVAAVAAPPRPKNVLIEDSDVVLNEQYRFDNFVVGPCNRFAHAAAVGIAEKPGQTYNPYFLHGSVGLGKTHLLQSLCHSLIERTRGTRILYLSCETFVNHFIAAIGRSDLQNFRNRYRNVDVLVVDDIQLLANKERTQEEFFHTFNTLYLAGKQIVLSSDSPPDIPSLQGRLVSRFKWGLVTEIEMPCYETRMAILKRKSRDRGHELPDDVACLLAERIESNIRELEGAVTKLLSYAELNRLPLGVDLVRTCLRELFTVRRGTTSMEDIMRVVTEHFNVKLSDLQSRKRTAMVAYPRQVAMYLARGVTRLSLEEIGGFFGGRDHSTVLYAVQKVEKLVQNDEPTKAMIGELSSRLTRP